MGTTSGGRRVRRATAVIGVGVLALVCVACTRDLGTLGGVYGAAADINDSGVIVGYSDVGGGMIHAFVKTPNGSMKDLGTGTRSQSKANAINGAGVVVGATADRGPSALLQTPFAWSSSKGLVELPLPATTGTAWAVDVNDAGAVAVNGNVGSATHAYVYDPGTGTYTPLAALAGGTYELAAAIAPDGTVVGTARSSSGVYHAVSWSATTHAITDLDAGSATQSNATGINSKGVVVGWTGDFSNPIAYTWSGGTRTTIGAGRAEAINDDGVIVGQIPATATTPDAAHLWDPGRQVSKDLAGLATKTGADAVAINDHGVPVGTALDAANLATPVRFDAYGGS